MSERKWQSTGSGLLYDSLAPGQAEVDEARTPRSSRKRKREEREKNWNFAAIGRVTEDRPVGLLNLRWHGGTVRGRYSGSGPQLVNADRRRFYGPGPWRPAGGKSCAGDRTHTSLPGRVNPD